MDDSVVEQDESLISEVGYIPGPINEEDKWKFMFEQQNKSFTALIAAMQQSKKGKIINLPEFDPGLKNSDARAWVSTADLCMIDETLNGTVLMSAISKALKGEAATWFAQVSYAGMTWHEFKELFLARYNYSETTAEFLINVNQSKPKADESLASYAATLLSSLLTQWKDLSNEQIAVSTVLAHISQFDPRVRRLASTVVVENRGQLQRELKTMSFLKRPAEKIECDQSRFDKIKCFKCDKWGHKAAQCRMEKNKNNWNVPETKMAKSGVTCFKCKELGHYASSCSKRNEAKISTRRVDVCTVNVPTGIMKHLGENFPYFYDSGAECSLIKKSVSSRL